MGRVKYLRWKIPWKLHSSFLPLNGHGIQFDPVFCITFRVGTGFFYLSTKLLHMHCMMCICIEKTQWLSLEWSRVSFYFWRFEFSISFPGAQPNILLFIVFRIFSWFHWYMIFKNFHPLWPKKLWVFIPFRVHSNSCEIQLFLTNSLRQSTIPKSFVFPTKCLGTCCNTVSKIFKKSIIFQKCHKLNSSISKNHYIKNARN